MRNTMRFKTKGDYVASAHLQSNTNTPTLVSFGGRLPVLCADHRQAHLTLLINVGVIDLCLECDLGRLERVLGGENDFDSERTFVIRRVVLEFKKGCQ